MDSNVPRQQRFPQPNLKVMPSATTSTTSGSNRYRNPILTKRVRRPNFTPYELEALVTAMEKRADLVSGRLGGAYQRHGDLNKAWEEVCAEVNSFSLVEREVRECKDKWTDLKYRTKIKAVRSRVQTDDSNNSSPSQQAVLSPVEERIMDLIIDRITPADESTAESSCKEQSEGATTVRERLASLVHEDITGTSRDEVHPLPSLNEEITQQEPANSAPHLPEALCTTPSLLEQRRQQQPIRREEPLLQVPFLPEVAPLASRELVAVAVDIREELRSLVDLERQKVELKRRKLDLEFARLHLQAKQYGFQLVKTEP